eukprot:Skav222560  [mRNA]  locus=scaffold791:87505:89793:+ [translate_table: standard]
MAQLEAASAAKILAGLPKDVRLADVADHLKSQSWLFEPKLVTRTLARLASTHPLSALHLLTYMQSQQIQANTFHYTAVIAGCARGGAWELAVNLLQQMVEHQIQRDSVTFNSAINACGKSAQWQMSLSLLTSMCENEASPGTDTMNSAMGACTPAGQWELALWIFGDVKTPDVITFSSALAACDKGSQWRASLQLLERATRASDLVLDNYGFSAVISACASAERWEFACHILERMAGDAVLVDVVTYGSVLKALSAGKEWAMALRLLYGLESHELSNVTFNSAISACSLGSQWQHACSLLTSMRSLQFLPEDVSYNTAITACVRGSTWQQGLILFDQMAESFLKPDLISFNSVLSACRKGSQWQLGLTLLEKMSILKLEPDEFCFTTGLSACEAAGWQLCLRVLSGLRQQVKVTPVMFGVLMSACERECAWQTALATLHAIISEALIPDALHTGSAANALRQEGEKGEEAARKLLRQMKRLWTYAWTHRQQQDFRYAQTTLQRWHQHHQAATGASTSSTSGSGKTLVIGHGVVACFKPAGIATEVFVDELATEVFPDASADAFSIVSRLDHPTSGILMVALGAHGSPSANWLQVQFASRLVDKKYICLCEGLPLGSVGTTGSVFAPLCADEVRGCMMVAEGGALGRESLTKYRVLARYEVPLASTELMLLEVKPITGRTHQIRVHMAHIGRPLVGDLTYGAKELSILSCERLFLHCRRVQLRDFSDQKFCAVSSLPAELRQVLAKLQPLSAPQGRREAKMKE